MLYIAANSMIAMALVCSYISDLMELLMFHILVNKCVIWSITSWIFSTLLSRISTYGPIEPDFPVGLLNLDIKVKKSQLYMGKDGKLYALNWGL